MPLHLTLSQTDLTDSLHSSPVQSFILSSHLFPCLPLFASLLLSLVKLSWPCNMLLRYEPCHEKTCFCIFENKGTDQRLYFRFIGIVQTIYCRCTARFVSDLVGNPEGRFSHDAGQSPSCTFVQVVSILVTMSSASSLSSASTTMSSA